MVSLLKRKFCTCSLMICQLKVVIFYTTVIYIVLFFYFFFKMLNIHCVILIVQYIISMYLSKIFDL
jgi:hypothetical protein